MGVQEIDLEPPAHHVTLATMNSLGLQPTLIASPTQQAVSSEQQNMSQARSGIETLYSINQHTAGSPQFQISRHIPENMVRHLSESMLRDSMVRDTLNRDNNMRDNMNRENLATSQNMTRHIDSGEENINRQLRQITENSANQQTREVQEQQQQQQQQGLPASITVEAGEIPVSRGLHLLSQGVLPGSLQFTTLLNSDLVAIGEAVIRNQSGIPTMFQQKFGPAQ